MTNILACEEKYTEFLLKNSLFDYLFLLVKNGVKDLWYEHFLWCIGNLLGNKINFNQIREKIFESELMEIILTHSNLDDKKDIKLKRLEAWIFSNCLRGPNYPKYDQVPIFD